MIARFLSSLLLLLTLPAWASFPAFQQGGTGYEYSISGRTPAVWFPTTQALCDAEAAKITADNHNGITYVGVGSGAAPGGYGCNVYNPTYPAGCSPVTSCFRVSSPTLAHRTPPLTYSCPSNATLDGTSCTCSAGYNQRQTDGVWACVSEAEDCPPGKKATLNPTTGWGWVAGFSSDGRAIVRGAPGRVAGDGNTPPETICDGRCSMVADGGPEDFWIAKDSSSTGLFRISVSQQYMNTGATCTTRTPDLDQNMTASCPGTMGQVNGQTVCLASSDSPSPAPSKDLGDRKMGNNPTPGGTGDGKMGPNGEMGTKEGDRPDGTAGGSTGGTGGGAKSSSGGSVTRSNPDGSTDTFTWGDMTSPKTPGVPELYRRKYDSDPGDYLVARTGVFAAKASGFVSVAFQPPWRSDGAGQCPKFSLPLGQIGPWSLSGGDVSVPCNVWAFCRIVIILSALFLARSLIFGG